MNPPSELPAKGTTYVGSGPLTPQAPVGKLNTGRIVTYLGAGAALLAALAPAVANLDLTSTAGLGAGVIALAGVVIKWLDGWQKYEQDVRDPAKLNEPAP